LVFLLAQALPRWTLFSLLQEMTHPPHPVQRWRSITIASLLPFEESEAEAVWAPARTAAPAPPALRKSLLETFFSDIVWFSCSEKFIIYLLLAS
jgi:hypothetical protein